MRDSNSRLVYSSDPKANEKCPKCKEIRAACRCLAEAAGPAKFTAVLRIERQGRGGKTVTVIDRLPRQESYLKELCGELKRKCGCGGSFRADGPEGGLIEIQGDQREKIRALLAARKIPVKGM